MDEQPKYRRRKGGFTARTKQCNRVLDVAFETGERGLFGRGNSPALFGERRVVSTSRSPTRDFGTSIVEAYTGNVDDVGTIVEAASEGWAMSRMSAVSHSILHAVATELVYVGTNCSHAIPGQVSLTREYSAERSVGFVMGIFNRVTNIRTRKLVSGRELSEGEEAGGQEAN